MRELAPRGRATLRATLCLCALVVACGRGADDGDAGALPATVRFTNAVDLGVRGRGWTDTPGPYDRLPTRAEQSVPAAVWRGGREPAGVNVRFASDATRIFARWRVSSPELARPTMAATAVSGLDLFVRTDAGWRWLGVGAPQSFPENTAEIAREMPPGRREYLLYLPLFNGVESLEIGVEAPFRVDPVPADDARPIVFYGTSIVQGALASRPGASHTAILSRRLGRPVVNLGFAGNARMEPALAELVAELDPALFVVSCLPNMTADEIRERAEPFVETLRRARPDTPILLLEDRTYANAFLVTEMARRNRERRAASRDAHRRLVERGIGDLWYVRGDALLGPEGDDTVDGSHPSDLGFLRMADALEPVLREILGSPKSSPPAGS